MQTMSELNLTGQRLLIREDLNVPMHEGKISNHKRIEAALPTLKTAIAAGAKVLVMSHLGRPKEGHFDSQFSLAPVAEALSHALGQEVKLINNSDAAIALADGQVALLENVRFNTGEKACDETLSRQLASLCDVFVMDAFATAHRKQASTYGVAKYAPKAVAGPLLSREIAALKRVLSAPKTPVLAIVGGAKVSSKLSLLHSLIPKVNALIVGGGIANTFLAARGHSVGSSLYEADLVDEARALLTLAERHNVDIPLPTDARVSPRFDAESQATIKPIGDVATDEMILDIGPKTESLFAKHIAQAGTILWNGPVGVFEFPAFSHGTKAMSLAIAECSGFSVAGGGDTLAAIDHFAIADKIDYISTGGGAFLEYIEKGQLPAVEILG